MKRHLDGVSSAFRARSKPADSSFFRRAPRRALSTRATRRGSPLPFSEIRVARGDFALIPGLAPRQLCFYVRGHFDIGANCRRVTFSGIDLGVGKPFISSERFADGETGTMKVPDERYAA